MTRKMDLGSNLLELVVNLLTSKHELSEGDARKLVETHPEIIEEHVEAAAHRLSARASDETLRPKAQQKEK